MLNWIIQIQRLQLTKVFMSKKALIFRNAKSIEQANTWLQTIFPGFQPQHTALAMVACKYPTAFKLPYMQCQAFCDSPNCICYVQLYSLHWTCMRPSIYATGYVEDGCGGDPFNITNFVLSPEGGGGLSVGKDVYAIWHNWVEQNLNDPKASLGF